ncbi:hypothetical protein ACFXGA_06100 [Actinosynnema sp. NPDC059335]|uniref:hypothetical protein n=1 Tax=Actinosynnema sp. NPDC059335 TaxID=3346804 RepID=UPI003670C7F7
MSVTVGGTSLDTLVWNVRTLGSRLATAGRRGGNLATAGLDGARWQPKPLAELTFDLAMWILGSDTDGLFPESGTLRGQMRARYDELLRIMGQQYGLTEIVDTDSGRRCFAEIQGAIGPTTMAAGSRAEVTFPLVVPAGCWEDVAVLTTPLVVLPASGPVTLTGLGGGNLPLTGLTVRLRPPARNVRITCSDGSWLQVSGDLPAGDDLLLTLTDEPTARQEGSSVDLLHTVDWSGTSAYPLAVPVTSSSDPVVTVTAEATTAASRIQVSGRRRWQSA